MSFFEIEEPDLRYIFCEDDLPPYKFPKKPDAAAITRAMCIMRIVRVGLWQAQNMPIGALADLSHAEYDPIKKFYKYLDFTNAAEWQSNVNRLHVELEYFLAKGWDL